MCICTIYYHGDISNARVIFNLTCIFKFISKPESIDYKLKGEFYEESITYTD